MANVVLDHGIIMKTAKEYTRILYFSKIHVHCQTKEKVYTAEIKVQSYQTFPVLSPITIIIIW